jgi:hypothetical protein
MYKKNYLYFSECLDFYIRTIKDNFIIGKLLELQVFLII